MISANAAGAASSGGEGTIHHLVTNQSLLANLVARYRLIKRNGETKTMYKERLERVNQPFAVYFQRYPLIHPIHKLRAVQLENLRVNIASCSGALITTQYVLR